MSVAPSTSTAAAARTPLRTSAPRPLFGAPSDPVTPDDSQPMTAVQLGQLPKYLFSFIRALLCLTAARLDVSKTSLLFSNFLFSLARWLYLKRLSDES